MHTTEPAHHRAAGLCAVRRCAATLRVIQLGGVEGHPSVRERRRQLIYTAPED